MSLNSCRTISSGGWLSSRPMTAHRKHVGVLRRDTKLRKKQHLRSGFRLREMIIELHHQADATVPQTPEEDYCKSIKQYLVVVDLVELLHGQQPGLPCAPPARRPARGRPRPRRMSCRRSWSSGTSRGPVRGRVSHTAVLCGSRNMDAARMQMQLAYSPIIDSIGWFTALWHDTCVCLHPAVVLVR